MGPCIEEELEVEKKLREEKDEFRVVIFEFRLFDKEMQRRMSSLLCPICHPCFLPG